MSTTADKPPRSVVRGVALSAFATALVALVCVLVFNGGSSYMINAHFLDAGQLVPGGLVEVAGRPVGTISGIRLTPDGQADVQLSISDSEYAPLHQGTFAGIRAVGLAGITNRFVDLSPGPAYTPALPSGSVLGTDHTSGIVDIDELLDAFTPATRAGLEALIAHSNQVFAGSGARYFNGVLSKLSPGLEQIAGLTGQLAADRAGLTDLISTAGTAAQAVASRRPALEGAVANTARALGAIASERTAFSDELARLPGVLTQATPTLALARTTLLALKPDLGALPPAAAPLALALGRLGPTAARLLPVAGQVNRLLPPLDSALRGFVPLRPVADRALSSTATALQRSMHIFTGLREYGSDLAIGVFAGLAGIATAPYDGIGHYVRLDLMLSPQTNTAGLLQALIGNLKLLPGLSGQRTAIAPCPGGAAPPAPDGSSPWIPDPSLCNPLDDH